AAGISIRERSRRERTRRGECVPAAPRAVGSVGRRRSHRNDCDEGCRMILLYGRLDDPPFSSTVEALQLAGAEYALLDQATLDRQELCIEVGPDAIRGTLVVAGQEV